LLANDVLQLFRRETLQVTLQDVFNIREVIAECLCAAVVVVDRRHTLEARSFQAQTEPSAAAEEVNVGKWRSLRGIHSLLGHFVIHAVTFLVTEAESTFNLIVFNCKNSKTTRLSRESETVDDHRALH
jgi:hypothetical protein